MLSQIYLSDHLNHEQVRRCVQAIRDELRRRRLTGEACLWHELRDAGFTTEIVQQALLSMHRHGELKVVLHPIPIMNRVLRFFYLASTHGQSHHHSLPEAA